MGLFSGFLKGEGKIGSVINPGFLAGGPIGGYLYGEKGMDVMGAGARKDLSELERKQAEARAGAKQTQLGMLGQMRGPVTTPQMEARIKALEEESKAGPLVSDPYFQGARAKLATGGAQELSAIQNVQRGMDVSGGFKNVGSMQDVYDRLGAQLAQLGQQSTQRKAQSRDAAAEMRQGIADAQISYDNEILRAKMAIEAGDAAAAQDAMNKAYAARESIKQRTQQLFLGAAQLGIGAISANPLAASGGAKTLAEAGPTTTNAMQSNLPSMAQENYWSQQASSPLGSSITSGLPWSYTRRGR